MRMAIRNDHVVVCGEQIAMHEPGDEIIVADSGLAVAPGLHTLFDIAYIVVSTKSSAVRIFDISNRIE